MNVGKNFGVILIHSIFYLILVFHFSAIAFSLMIENPIGYVYKKEIKAYVDPLFTQNWNLFAPNPIASNQTLLLRFTMYNNGDSTKTEWLDIKKNIHDERKRNFWSPLQRMEKYIGSITESIVQDQISLQEFIQKKDSVSKDSLARLTELFRANYGHRSLVKYSKIVYNRLRFSEKRIDSLFLSYRIVNSEFPRFSKRGLDYYDLKNHRVSFYEFDLKRVF
jgi:hypothetical protein